MSALSQRIDVQTWLLLWDCLQESFVFRKGLHFQEDLFFSIFYDVLLSRCVESITKIWASGSMHRSESIQTPPGAAPPSKNKTYRFGGLGSSGRVLQTSTKSGKYNTENSRNEDLEKAGWQVWILLRKSLNFDEHRQQSSKHDQFHPKSQIFKKNKNYTKNTNVFRRGIICIFS